MAAKRFPISSFARSVEWKATTEDIPEAGGETALEQIVSVEWLSPLN
jgi:hypothetical protein